MAKKLPAPLTKAISAATAAIAAHPNGELELAQRRALWTALGKPEFDPEGFAEGVGHSRRVELAQLACRSILQYWTRAFPDDARPQGLLDTVDAYVSGDASSGPLWEAIDALGPVLEGMEDHRAACVGHAALHVAQVALNDEGFEDDPEEELDPEAPNPASLDSGWFASVACAGLGEDEPSVKERRRFWAWYVEEAVPEAFETFGD